MLKEIREDRTMNNSKLKKIISKEIMENKKVIWINSNGILHFKENGKEYLMAEWVFQCDDFGVRTVRIKESEGETPDISFYDYEKKEFISKDEIKNRYL